MCYVTLRAGMEQVNVDEDSERSSSATEGGIPGAGTFGPTRLFCISFRAG